MARDGSLARHGVKPGHVPGGEVAGIVAHFALDHARLRPGDTVLVRGASGPLGIMAVQLAALQHAGAVAVTASSDARGERLRRLGATHVLDRAGTMDGDEVDGFDVIIDVVAGPDFAAFIEKLRPGGRMVMVGAVCSPPADVTTTMFANFQRSLGFSTFGSLVKRDAAERYPFSKAPFVSGKGVAAVVQTTAT